MSNLSENLFYDPEYIKTQGHEELRVFDDGQFKIVFSIENGVVRSLSRGLFGSIGIKSRAGHSEFLDFFKDVVESLRKEVISKMEVIHPPNLYQGFVSEDWLEQIGFREKYCEINHHIELSNFEMHPMERRKLDKLNSLGFTVSELEQGQLSQAYDFLARCRKEKDLELNISLEKLSQLFLLFPDRYTIFGGYLAGQLISAVITVRITKEVVYYYLPGTSEVFKKESPMVGLIQHLVDYFKRQTRHLDLGISSVQGKPQEGLIAFKERMGGMKTEKKVFSLNLDLFPAP